MDIGVGIGEAGGARVARATPKFKLGPTQFIVSCTCSIVVDYFLKIARASCVHY